MIEIEVGITSFLGHYLSDTDKKQEKQKRMSDVFQKLNNNFHNASVSEKKSLLQEAYALVEEDGKELVTSLEQAFIEGGEPANTAREHIILDLTLGIYRGNIEPAFRVQLWLHNDFHTPPLLKTFADFANHHGQEEFHVSRILSEDEDKNILGTIRPDGVMFVPDVVMEFSSKLRANTSLVNEITALVKESTVALGIDGMTVRYPNGFNFYLVADPNDSVEERKLKGSLFIKQLDQLYDSITKSISPSDYNINESIFELIKHDKTQIRMIKIFGHDDYEGSKLKHVSPYTNIHDEQHDAAHLLKALRNA